MEPFEGRPDAVLKHIRSSRIRASETVVELGKQALKGDDVWNVHEQTLIAALDIDDEAVASRSAAAISAQFDGARASRLRGMVCEAKGDWKGAAEIYESMLESNSANAAALKRQICIAKGKGDVVAAVEGLTSYLDKFQSDKAAWQALGEMYAAHSQFHHAIFCYEELTLFEPTAAHYHCRLGELHYTNAASLSTAKKVDGLINARKYFAFCLDLAKGSKTPPPDARAATGLLLTAHAIAQAGKPDDELNVALATAAAAHLKSLYKRNANSDLVSTAIAPFVAKHSPPYR